MERAGFLRCQQDEEDQRVSRVYLTEAGRDIREELYRAEHQLEEEAFAGFTPEARAELKGSLSRVRENLLKVTRGRPNDRGRARGGKRRRREANSTDSALAVERESELGGEG
jgi:hypothetical protein